MPIFVNNWTNVFPLPDEANYLRLLHQPELTEDALHYLLDWRFGIRGRRKQQLFSIASGYTGQLNTLRRQGPSEPLSLLASFTDLPAEWKVFLLHLVSPGTYPLLHPYTLAAYAYIRQLEPARLLRKRREKFYVEEFLPFIASEFFDIPMTKTDKALYAFGKFISGRYPGLQSPA